MYCKKCGNEISDSAKFCPKCGAPQQVEYTPAQKDASVGKKKKKTEKKGKKKSPVKAIIAIFLVITIFAGGCLAGCLWIYPKFFNEKYLRGKLGKLTDKNVIEFYYDDFNGDSIKEAFAVVGTGEEDDFEKGEIWFVSDKAGENVKKNINGRLNGLLNEGGRKYISVEDVDREEETSLSYIYGVEEKDKYIEPEISGKYSDVHMEDGKIVNADGVEIKINGASEVNKAGQAIENYSNVKVCKYGDNYYSVEEDGFYKYDSEFQNKALIDGDIYYYDSTLSVYDNVLYFSDDKDNTIKVYDTDNYSFEVFYNASDENAYNVRIFSYNDSLIISEYNNGVYLYSENKTFDKIVDGNFINLIGSKIYYQVIDEASEIYSLMVYNLESDETTQVWSKHSSDIGNGEDISYYLWSIEDVEEFDGKVYFTIGTTQGSGGFYYGYAYCLDSDGTVTEIQQNGDPLDGGFGVGRFLLKYNDTLYVTLGSDRYSGSYGIAEIADNTISVTDGSICNIDDFDGRYIINYKYNDSENGTEKAGLYIYDMETGTNQCITESEKYLSAHQSEISDDINEFSDRITPDMYSVNYNYSAFCGDYIVFNPVVCLPDGVWTNAGHTVVACGYEAVKLVK